MRSTTSEEEGAGRKGSGGMRNGGHMRDVEPVLWLRPAVNVPTNPDRGRAECATAPTPLGRACMQPPALSPATSSSAPRIPKKTVLETSCEQLLPHPYPLPVRRERRTESGEQCLRELKCARSCHVSGGSGSQGITIVSTYDDVRGEYQENCAGFLRRQVLCIFNRQHLFLLG